MPHEHYAARSHPEFVVLDIGAGFGALILRFDAAMHGVEVEISRCGAQRDGRHKQILERRCGKEAAFTAVFDALAEGSYMLWIGDQVLASDVRIDGGCVSELDLRVVAMA